MPFLVGGVICLVNSDNSLDSVLLNSPSFFIARGILLRGTGWKLSWKVRKRLEKASRERWKKGCNLGVQKGPKTDFFPQKMSRLFGIFLSETWVLGWKLTFYATDVFGASWRLVVETGGVRFGFIWFSWALGSLWMWHFGCVAVGFQVTAGNAPKTFQDGGGRVWKNIFFLNSGFGQFCLGRCLAYGERWKKR